MCSSAKSRAEAQRAGFCKTRVVKVRQHQLLLLLSLLPESDRHSCRYYEQQKAIDTASIAAAKIEGRSRQREAQERQAEYALLQNRQQVQLEKLQQAANSMTPGFTFVDLQALHMHQLACTKAEEEDRIAAVLQQRMLESQRSAKELQQLRNQSAELRDLQVNTSVSHCR